MSMSSHFDQCFPMMLYWKDCTIAYCIPVLLMPAQLDTQLSEITINHLTVPQQLSCHRC